MALKSRSENSSSWIEMATIGAIVLLVAFVELRYGIFSAVSDALTRAIPGSRSFGVAGIGAAWVGLALYTVRRRQQLGQERVARLTVEDDLERFRITDTVTGLPNRLGFAYVLDQVFTEHPGEPVSVFGVGLCNHQTIASVHGGKLSDQLEVALCSRLVALTGPNDFVARSDNGTYLVFTTGMPLDGRRFHHDRLIEALCAFANAGITVDGVDLQPYLVFGSLDTEALISEDNEALVLETTAENLIQRVEFVLLRAAKRGHETVERFTPEVETAMVRRAQIEAALPQAIRDRQIVPYFQPFIDLNSHEVTGFEILARWEHPTNGLISPGEFIPVAEDTGILATLTLSILDQACEAAREWPDHTKLAINVSPTDLRDGVMMTRFLEILGRSGIRPHRLEIEITENAFIEEADSITSSIETLKNAGVTISIDDFGTGYSSLHHLKNLPFDKIKIDQSFVKDLATNRDSKAIVEAVVALSRSLDLQTTAEGIEAGDNRSLLQTLGCGIGQGFHFARPLPRGDVAGFLANHVNEPSQDSQVA